VHCFASKARKLDNWQVKSKGFFARVFAPFFMVLLLRAPCVNQYPTRSQGAFMCITCGCSGEYHHDHARLAGLD
jgi:hypothetical protein